MKNMTLMQHFSELRRRVLFVAIIFFCAMMLGWYISPWMQEFLTTPLLNVWQDGELVYTGLSDGLMIRFSLSVLFALLVAMPVGLWNAWAFVAPGLKKSERKFIWPVMFLSPILFIAGCAFAFYLLFPFAFKFFIDLNQQSTVPSIILPVARDYLTFTIGLLKVFGVAFQLPLVLVLLNKIGVLSRTRAIKMRSYAVVIIVAMAAVLTPPDIVSQILLALPMWALFEVSILFMKKEKSES